MIIYLFVYLLLVNQHFSPSHLLLQTFFLDDFSSFRCAVVCPGGIVPRGIIFQGKISLPSSLALSCGARPPSELSVSLAVVGCTADADRAQKHGMDEFISANPCNFDHGSLFELVQRLTLDHRLNDSYSCLVSAPLDTVALAAFPPQSRPCF